MATVRPRFSQQRPCYRYGLGPHQQSIISILSTIPRLSSSIYSSFYHFTIIKCLLSLILLYIIYYIFYFIIKKVFLKINKNRTYYVVVLYMLYVSVKYISFTNCFKLYYKNIICCVFYTFLHLLFASKRVSRTVGYRKCLLSLSIKTKENKKKGYSIHLSVLSRVTSTSSRNFSSKSFALCILLLTTLTMQYFVKGVLDIIIISNKYYTHNLGGN